MQHALTFLGIVTLMVLSSATASGEDASPLRVMTFNIRYDAGEESASPSAWVSSKGTHRRDLALRVIEESNPDILGLQEVLPNQRKDLAERLSEYEGYGVGRDDGQEMGEQCAIFVRKDRFEIEDKGTVWLCDTPEKVGTKHPDAACVRIASWMRLQDKQADGRVLWVVNSHWDHVSQPARQQAAELLRKLAAEHVKDAPLLIMGDFNAGEKSKEIITLLAPENDEHPQLADVYRKVHPEAGEQEASFQNFTTRTRGHRIDYILATPHFEPESARIVTTSYEGRVPSDHYPVVAELKWSGGSPR